MTAELRRRKCQLDPSSGGTVVRGKAGQGVLHAPGQRLIQIRIDWIIEETSGALLRKEAEGLTKVVSIAGNIFSRKRISITKSSSSRKWGGNKDFMNVRIIQCRSQKRSFSYIFIRNLI